MSKTLAKNVTKGIKHFYLLSERVVTSEIVACLNEFTTTIKSIIKNLYANWRINFHPLTSCGAHTCVRQVERRFMLLTFDSLKLLKSDTREMEQRSDLISI